MKLLLIAAALAVPLAGGAWADDRADAMGNCLGAFRIIGERNPDDAAQYQSMAPSMCGCVLDGVGKLGADGAKWLHMLAHQPPEQGAEQDRAKDRTNSVALLVSLGMSEGDATALFDRINPIFQSLQQQCMAKLQASRSPI